MSNSEQFVLNHKEGNESAPYWKRNNNNSGYAVLIIDDQFREVLACVRNGTISRHIEPDKMRKHCVKMINNYENIELIMLARFQLVGKKKEEGPCFEAPPSILQEYIAKKRLIVLLDLKYQIDDTDDTDAGAVVDDTYGVDLYNRLTGVLKWNLNNKAIAFYSRFPEKVCNELGGHNPVCVWKENKSSDATVYNIEDWLNSILKMDVCGMILNDVSKVWKTEECNRGHDALPKSYMLEEICELAWDNNFRDSQCKKSIFFQPYEKLNIAPSDKLSCYNLDNNMRNIRVDALSRLIDNMIFKDRRIKGTVNFECDENILNRIISLPCLPGIVFIYWLLIFLRTLDDYSGVIKLSIPRDGIICLSIPIKYPHEIYGKVITRGKHDGTTIPAIRSLLQCIIPGELDDIPCVQGNRIKEETGNRSVEWIAPVLELRAEKDRLQFFWDGYTS